MRHDVSGQIYLLHFDRAYPAGSRPRHYIGWTERENVTERLWEHTHGRGAALMEVIHEARIGFVVAAIWAGTRADERRAKGRGGASRICPICQAEIRSQKMEVEK